MQGSHSFNVKLATLYGIESAVILQHLHYWCEINKKQKRNFYDGCYWTFNSYESFTANFPYLKDFQIRRILKNLEEEKLIKTGCFNKMKYDRTKWYTVTEFGVKTIKNCIIDSVDDLTENAETITQSHLTNSSNGNDEFVQCHLMNSSNGNDEFVRPIPNLNTNLKTNLNTNLESSNFDLTLNKEYSKELFEKWQSKGLKNLKSYISFIQYEYKNSIKFLHGYHSQDVFNAIENYSKVKKLNSSDTWFTADYSFETFVKQLDKFIPDRFELEHYLTNQAKENFKNKVSSNEFEDEDEEKKADIYKCPLCNTQTLHWSNARGNYRCAKCNYQFSYSEVNTKEVQYV